MPKTKIQATQSILEIVLSELGNLSRDQLDTIYSKINNALMEPGAFICTGIDKFVTVNSTSVVMPTGKNKILSLGAVSVAGLSGSMNFATGIGSGDVQTVVVPTIVTPGNWIKAGFEIRTDRKIYVVFGAEGTSEAAATFPAYSTECLPLGYVSLHDDGAGAFLNVTLPFLYQISSLAPRYQSHASLDGRSSANQHPALAIQPDVGQFSGELSATEDEVQKALVRLEKYGSIFPWEIGKAYRVGNVVRDSNQFWICKTAHTAGATFDVTKFDLAISYILHSMLDGRSTANQHPTTSISTTTGEFSGELSTLEDEVQKALVRLEQYGSVFPWATGKAYRVGNIVKYSNQLWICNTAHTAGGAFDTPKFDLSISYFLHSMLDGRSTTNQHPTSAISTATGEFSGQLNATEDDVQKALVRLEQFSAVFPWATGKAYRLYNTVSYLGEDWTCTTAHTAGVTFDETKWSLNDSPPQEELQTVTNLAGVTVFTLATVVIPTSRSRLMVFVNGVYNKEITHYTVDSSTQITFLETIPKNAQVIFRVN